MKVFNLTDKNVVYRGKTLKPYEAGDFPYLSYIPDRDMKLQHSKILAFGKLPKGWTKPLEKISVEKSKPTTQSNVVSYLPVQEAIQEAEDKRALEELDRLTRPPEPMTKQESPSRELEMSPTDTVVKDTASLEMNVSESGNEEYSGGRKKHKKS